jgi:hypothetical protein
MLLLDLSLVSKIQSANPEVGIITVTSITTLSY